MIDTQKTLENCKEIFQLSEKEKEKLCKIRKQHEEIQREYTRLCIAYRNESVMRVLEFILSNYRNKKICNLDILLTHCLNKISGNIDGVELTLDEHLVVDNFFKDERKDFSEKFLEKFYSEFKEDNLIKVLEENDGKTMKELSVAIINYAYDTLYLVAEELKGSENN